MIIPMTLQKRTFSSRIIIFRKLKYFFIIIIIIFSKTPDAWQEAPIIFHHHIDSHSNTENDVNGNIHVFQWSYCITTCSNVIWLREKEFVSRDTLLRQMKVKTHWCDTHLRELKFNTHCYCEYILKGTKIS